MNGINNFYNDMSNLSGKSKLAAKGYTDNFVDNKKTKGKSKYDTADFSDTLEKTQKKNDDIKVEKNSATEKTAELSETAQSYLDKLKEKYPDMDFIIADFSTDAEADKLLSQGKGEYNVLLTPDLLERMANDGETAAKYEAIIDESVGQFTEKAEELDDYREDVADKYGVSVDSKGTVNYYALLNDGFSTDDGKDRVTASTMEELLDKLSEIREKQKAAAAEEAEKDDEAKKNDDKDDEKMKTAQSEQKKYSPYEYGQYSKPPVNDVQAEVEEAVNYTV